MGVSQRRASRHLPNPEKMFYPQELTWRQESQLNPQIDLEVLGQRAPGLPFPWLTQETSKFPK